MFCCALFPLQALAADYNKAELREFLRKNPDVLLDVLRDNKVKLLEIVEQGAEARRDEQRKKRLDAELAQPLIPEIEAGRPIRGAKDAPVTVVEYSDFFCKFCGRAAGTIKELLDKNQGKVRILYKHFPLSDFSRQTAIFYEAATLQKPDKTFELYDKIFSEHEKILAEKEAGLDMLASSLGYDLNKLHEDMKKPEIAAQVDKDAAEAQKFGFTGTPSFLFNGVSIQAAAPLETYEDLVRMVLKRGKPEQSKSE